MVSVGRTRRSARRMLWSSADGTETEVSRQASMTRRLLVRRDRACTEVVAPYTPDEMHRTPGDAPAGRSGRRLELCVPPDGLSAKQVAQVDRARRHAVSKGVAFILKEWP